MKKTESPRKIIPFEQSSRQQIEQLLKIGAEVSRFWAPIAYWVSHFLVALNRAMFKEMAFIARVCDLSIARFASFPPFDVWLRGTPPQAQEVYPSTEMERTNISYVLNLIAARKIVSNLTKRVALQTPKPSLLFSPLYLEPEAGSLEETVEMPAKEIVEMPVKEPSEASLEAPFEKSFEKPLDERARTVFGVAANLQRRFESDLATSIKGLASAIQEYGGQTIWLTRLLAMPEPLVNKVPTRVGRLPPRPLSAPSEAVTPHVGVPEKPLERISEPSLKRKETLAEPEREFRPPLLMPAVRWSQESARTFMRAAELPSFVYRMETGVLSSPTPATPSPVRLLQATRFLEAVSPSLISWIYGESEVLRGTGLGLSVVPTAAAAAQRIVTDALFQPISSFEAPLPLPAAESVSTGLPTLRPETTVGPAEYETFRLAEYETFRLPAMLSSLMVAQGQKYPLFFTEPSISRAYESAESLQVASEETAAFEAIPEAEGQIAAKKAVAPSGLLGMGRVSKLPTVIALAAAESLITQRLQLEFNALVKELHVARPSFGGKLSELGAVGGVRTTMLGRLTEVAPALSPALAPYHPTAPVSIQPPLARPSPPNLPVQNTFNITVSGERTEEDLRDLEDKISRILAEQVRRYYGSARI